MERSLISVSRFFGFISAAALVVLMFAIVLDVTVRFITRASVPGILELAETALVASAFLGAAWTAVKGGHIEVDVLTSRMPPPARRVVLSAIWALSSLILAWLTWASFARALHSTAVRESRFGLLDWPLYPTRWVIVVGLLLWTLIALANLARALRGRPLFGQPDADAGIAAGEDRS